MFVLRRVLAGLTLISLLAPGCAKDACDGEILSRAVTATSSVPREQRTELMSQALLEACTSADAPLPPSLRAALTAVREYDPWSAFPVVVRAIHDDPSLWLQACSRGTGAFNAVKWSDKAALHLARACGTERLSFATEGDFARAAPLGTLVAVLAWPWLSEKGTDKTRAHSVAVALMAGE